MSIITAILDFFHARKYLSELLLLGVVIAAVWYWHHATFEAGIQQERAVWMAKLTKQQHDADVESGKLQAKADIAEHVHDQEITDLRQYQHDHPLHGSFASLCKPANSGVPQASTDHKDDGGTAPAPGHVLDVPHGDSGGEPDQLGMLQVAFAKCDALSAQVREWQSR